MSVITYQIVSGVAPFKVAIIPQVIPIDEIPSTGIYETENIPIDGVYSMRVTDHDNCYYQVDDIVIGNIVPSTTTTTTTTTSTTTTTTTTPQVVIEFAVQFHNYVCIVHNVIS